MKKKRNQIYSLKKNPFSNIRCVGIKPGERNPKLWAKVGGRGGGGLLDRDITSTYPWI